MPTYEYRCRSCGEELEAVQSFTDDALTECPACGGLLRKVFGSIGITFKGSGFYKTDSRAGSSTSSSAKKSDSESKESKSDASSSESKSESRSDSKASAGTSPNGDAKKKSPTPAA